MPIVSQHVFMSALSLTQYTSLQFPLSPLFLIHTPLNLPPEKLNIMLLVGGHFDTLIIGDIPGNVIQHQHYRMSSCQDVPFCII